MATRRPPGPLSHCAHISCPVVQQILTEQELRVHVLGAPEMQDRRNHCPPKASILCRRQITDRMSKQQTRASAACQIEKKNEWVIFSLYFLPIDVSNLAFDPIFASCPLMGPSPSNLPSLVETFQFWFRLASLWYSVLGIRQSLGKYCAKFFICTG